MAVAKAIQANPYREHLRQELRTRDAVKAEWREAADALAAAEELVKDGERPQHYLTKFLDRVRRLAARLQELDSYPRLLQNTCQDATLRSELAIARELKSHLAGEWNRAANEVSKRQEAWFAITAKLRQRLGPGATLPAGEEPPWTTDYGKQVEWCRIGDTLHIDESTQRMDPSNVAFFLGEWRAATAAVRGAESVRDAVGERLREASASVDEIRGRLMRSPI